LVYRLMKRYQTLLPLTPAVCSRCGYPLQSKSLMEHICMLHIEYSDRCFRVSYASIAPNELHSLARPARGKGKEREDQIFQKERSTNTRTREYHRKSANLPFIRTEYSGSGHLKFFFEASLGMREGKAFYPPPA
jgi:hypothetical protein